MVATTIGAPEITEAPHRHILYQHFVVPHDEIGPTMQRSFAALYAYIDSQRVIPVGPPLAVYNTAQPAWDVDICAPIAGPIQPSGTFLYKELPASRVVTLTHVGPYEELRGAYDAVAAFIRDHKLTMSGAPREIYLSPPETPSSEIQTIVEWPIE